MCQCVHIWNETNKTISAIILFRVLLFLEGIWELCQGHSQAANDVPERNLGAVCFYKA